jgi:hypothetical protein
MIQTTTLHLFPNHIVSGKWAMNFLRKMLDVEWPMYRRFVHANESVVKIYRLSYNLDNSFSPRQFD